MKHMEEKAAKAQEQPTVENHQLFNHDVAVGFGTFDKNPIEATDVTTDRRTVAWVALDGNWGRVTHNIFHAFQGEQRKQLRHLSEYLTSNLKTELQLRQRITEITISKGTPLWK